MRSNSDVTPAPGAAPSETGQTPSPTCLPLHAVAQKPGEVICPVCYHRIPPEHIGYKLHCRRCGYLESCCNPV